MTKNRMCFDVDTDVYGRDIYMNGRFCFDSGVTVLLGCNGSGKTTLISLLSEELKRRSIPIYNYSKEKAASNLSMRAAIGSSTLDIGQYLSSRFLSEGEIMMSDFYTLSNELGQFIRDLDEEDRQAWVFFDGLDSGWSVDNIIAFKEFVNDCLLKEPLDLFVVIAANSYEFADENGWHLMDVQTAGYLKPFEDYGQYREYVLSTSETKKRIWS